MNIEEILETMDDMLERAWSLPLTGGRCVVDAMKVRDLIEEIRLNLPSEIKMARGIVADRNEILSEAKREAEATVRKAEERARALVAQEEIVRQAQERAQEVTSQAQIKSRELRGASHSYSDKVLGDAEEALTEALKSVKTTRNALRSASSTSRLKG